MKNGSNYYAIKFELLSLKITITVNDLYLDQIDFIDNNSILKLSINLVVKIETRMH